MIVVNIRLNSEYLRACNIFLFKVFLKLTLDLTMRFFLLLALMAVSLLLTSAIQPLGKGYNSHCMCVKLESRIIPQHSLRSVEIFPKGSHCKNTEVIASLVSGEKICLNPHTMWVRKLIQFIEKKEKVIKKA